MYSIRVLNNKTAKFEESFHNNHLHTNHYTNHIYISMDRIKTTCTSFIFANKVLLFAIIARCLYLSYVVVAIWETFVVTGTRKVDKQTIWLLFTGLAHDCKLLGCDNLPNFFTYQA